MIYRDPDETVYQGESADEIVQAMADAKFRPVRSLKSYRTATAKRIKQLFDKTIDPSNSEKFLQSMVDAGMLEKEG